MSCKFNKLPVELTNRIASDLDTVSLLNLRSTNHRLSTFTFDVFKVRCLQSRKIDLTKISSQRLDALAGNPTFAKYLHHLDITPASIFAQYGVRWELWGNSVDTSNPLEHKLASLRRLMRQSPVTSIRFATTEGAENAHYTATACDALELIFRLVGKETTPLMRKLDIDVLRGSNPGWLQEARLNVHLAQVTPGFLEQWKSLRELRLNVTLTTNSYESVARLVAKATGLQRLALNPGPCYGEKFLRSVLSDENACRGLRGLQIAGFSAPAEYVIELVGRSRETLRELAFDVTVRDTDGDEWGLAVVIAAINEVPLLKSLHIGEAVQDSLECKTYDTVLQAVQTDVRTVQLVPATVARGVVVAS